MYSYTCFYVVWEENVWVHLLGRWPVSKLVRSLVSIPVLPTASSLDFEWPTTFDIWKIQEDIISMFLTATINVMDCAVPQLAVFWYRMIRTIYSCACAILATLVRVDTVVLKQPNLIFVCSLTGPPFPKMDGPSFRRACIDYGQWVERRCPDHLDFRFCYKAQQPPIACFY